MFHHLHRRNWFPFLVVGLSVLLFGFVVWAYFSRLEINKTTQQVVNQPAVTASDYQHEVSNILKSFSADYAALDPQASNATAKLSLVENTEDKILAVRVPAEYRSFHLQLATIFEALRSDLLQNDSIKLAEDWKKINELLNNNSWLGVSVIGL